MEYSLKTKFALDFSTIILNDSSVNFIFSPVNGFNQIQEE